MQRAPSDAESSIFLGCRRQIRRISNTSCRKSFLKLRSDWAGCRFPPKLWANPACGLCMARQLGPRCACRPSHWPWPPAIVQGCSWLPSMCLAWAITPRAPSADRLCASERREQKTRWHSLKPPGQYGCSAVKSGHPAAWLPSHCPRFMPCTRCAQTNRPLSVRRQCLAFLRQPELSAPVGGRAPGLRSEGSWLAAELMRAGLEPGVLDRCAGWMGYLARPALPKVRPRPPAPHAPRLAHAHPPCPSPRAIGHPLPHCLTTDHFFVPRFVQVSIRALW